MKTIIKSLALVALFSTIGFTASAQLGASSSTSATARILKQITLTTDTIQFGTIAAGGGATYLDPITPSASTNVGFTSRAGRLVIDATPEEPIRVEFDSTVTMRKSAPSPDSITFRPILSVVHGDLAITPANQNTSVLLNSAALSAPTVATTAGGDGTGPVGIVSTQSGTDRVTLYLGGNIYDFNTTNPIPSTGRQTGTYRGTLSFNVVYQN